MPRGFEDRQGAVVSPKSQLRAKATCTAPALPSGDLFNTGRLYRERSVFHGTLSLLFRAGCIGWGQEKGGVSPVPPFRGAALQFTVSRSSSRMDFDGPIWLMSCLNQLHRMFAERSFP